MITERTIVDGSGESNDTMLYEHSQGYFARIKSIYMACGTLAGDNVGYYGISYRDIFGVLQNICVPLVSGTAGHEVMSLPEVNIPIKKGSDIKVKCDGAGFPNYAAIVLVVQESSEAFSNLG